MICEASPDATRPNASPGSLFLLLDGTNDRLTASDSIRHPVTVSERRLETMVLRHACLKPAIGVILSLVSWLPAQRVEADDFEKWEKEIAAFEQTDRTSPPPKGGILFI